MAFHGEVARRSRRRPASVPGTNMRPARVTPLLVLLIGDVQSFKPATPNALWRGRRDATVAAIAAAMLPLMPASAATLLSNDDKVIRSARAPTVKARALRVAVRDGGASTAARVAKERESVLAPLQKAMAAGAPKLEYLTEAEYATAQKLPLLLKGHLLELDDALRSDGGFVAYTSKETGATYPGGKVEREVRERALFSCGVCVHAQMRGLVCLCARVHKSALNHTPWLASLIACAAGGGARDRRPIPAPCEEIFHGQG